MNKNLRNGLITVAALAAATVGVIQLNTTTAPKVVELGRQSDGVAYKPKLNLNPGDTLRLTGTYKAIFLDSIYGSAEKPIIITGKGVIISGLTAYSFQIRGKHFKVWSENLGDITITGPGTLFYGSSGFGLGESSNYEISGVHIERVGVAFLQNPVAPTDMENIYIHHNRIINLNNPDPGALGRSEAFYMGNTGVHSPGKFKNCRIEDNYMENLSGDGIQVCQGNFSIKRNTIKAWGGAQLQWQRFGILVGDQASAQVENNILEGGKGQAFQFLGGGANTFKGNTIKDVNVSGLLNEDIVFITARNPNFSIDFSGNTFINCVPNRKVIFNGTADANTVGSVFSQNKGVSRTAVQLNAKDKWTDFTEPVPVPDPVPDPTPTPIETYTGRKGYWIIENKRVYYKLYKLSNGTYQIKTGDYTWYKEG